MADEPGDEPPAEHPKYDQDFFLDLAAEGKDAWNAWRRDPANKGVRATFAGIDFSEVPRDQIDFSGFEFGKEADFSGCKWRGGRRTEDPKAFTPGGACFAEACFGERANFTNVAFNFCACFAGAAFGAHANFTWAVFGRGAHFAGATFGNHSDFTGATFGVEARFSGAAFGWQANFIGVAFGDLAEFTHATFRWWASFTGAEFDGEANFTGANFSGRADFRCAAFGDEANFTAVNFPGGADFRGATFDQDTRFCNAIFTDRADFTGVAEDEWAKELKKCVCEEMSERSVLGMDGNAFNALKQRLGKRHKESGAKPDRFLTISFANARFNGEAILSGRSFEQIADFTATRFYYPPDFDTAEHLHRIDFTGAHVGFVRPGKWHWTTDTQVPLRLRALRKIVEETKNHDLERDLYIEERKAERGVYLHQLLGLDELKKNLEDIDKQQKHVWLEWRLQRRARNAHWLGILAKPVKIARLFTHLLWIAVMGVYWALADYGRSVAWPAAWLVSSGLFFYWCYSKILAPLMPKAGPLADRYEHAVGMVALGNAVPFVGPLTIDSEVKKFLFCAGDVSSNCTPIPPEGYQLLVIAQNLFSITCVFFIGLALRNYFRIK